MYKYVKSNLVDLHKLVACILHRVDATKIDSIQIKKCDQVIFNFPRGGFHGRKDNTLLIK